MIAVLLRLKGKRQGITLRFKVMKQGYKFNAQTGKLETTDNIDGTRKPVRETPRPNPKPNKTDEVRLIDGMEKRKANVPVEEGKVIFREKSDLTIFQIVDETTGTIMAYIAGYALDINFNMAELKSVERVEQLITGIGKMFRSVIMDKILGGAESKD